MQRAAIVVLALAFAAAVALACNELARSELLRSVRASHAATTPPPDAAVRPSAHRVRDFVQRLSDAEVLGWRRTPRYTQQGFQLDRLPADLRRDLLDFHAQARSSVEANGAHLRGNIRVASLQGTELERRLRAFLERKLQAWTGQRLDFVNSYGPRTYLRGATLGAHGDRLQTHAVSAIVYVQGPPWALQFVPNGARDDDRATDVFLGPQADVLLYESLQPHGREDPLQGDSFTAAFLHWSPPGWKELTQKLSEPQR
jgi:hypothetical protein